LYIGTTEQKTVNQKHVKSLVLIISSLIKRMEMHGQKGNQLLQFCDTLRQKLETQQAASYCLADSILR